MNKLSFLSILLISAILAACNNQGNKNNDKSLRDNAELLKNAKVEAGTSEDTRSSEDFAKEAASGGLLEVELGRYAQQNAENPRVKQFGAMMLRDHTKANDELKSIAAGKNLTLPASPDEDHQKILNDLMKKSGKEFDKDYMREMIDDHNKDVEEFRKQAESGNDPEIKAFAAKTLQVLLIHQDSAKLIYDAIK